jgi:hypothetical protein
VFEQYGSKKLERFHLFCGDRLWLIFYIYQAVTIRSACLISLSFKTKEFHNWAEDEVIQRLLCQLFEGDETNKLLKRTPGGLEHALDQIKAKFLREAASLMSGSKALTDSLSDLQATMSLEIAKISQQATRTR